ncbi:MAG TPA: hypothetical protein VHX42_04550 [Candidatus Babeliales bacterium]|jgi:hypothetical protein|nr:hypothetical protein [Candidatus Babeliales bacterium]
MSYTYQIIFALLFISNISLPSNPTSKKNNISEKSKNVEGLLNSEEALKNLESIKKISNQRGDVSLSPLYEIKIPTIPILSTNPDEKAFIAKLGIDIIRVGERALITRQDYIDEHGDMQSRKAIQKYKKHCIELQQKGDLKSLFNEIKLLYKIVMKNGDHNTFTDYISLAIAEQIYSDPLTIILYIIKHASIENAHDELQNLKIQIIEQAKQKNIVLMPEIKIWLIKQYGFDALQVAYDCYKSRND